MLETIKTMLTNQLGEFGPLIAIGALGLLLVLGTLPLLLNRQADPLDKLRKQRTEKNVANTQQSLRTAEGPDKLEKFSNFLEPQDEEEYSSIQLKLLQAGYKSKNAVRVFFFAQFALGLGLLGLGLIYMLLTRDDGDVSTKKMMMTVLIPGVIGYMAPKYWVTRRVDERKEEIINGFPDALDMMLVCVEAGQSLDQSIVRIAVELRAGFPALAEEFQIVAHEMKAGKDRIQVLRDLSERAGVPDISSFVTVLIQSAQFGTSIADALRVFADEMRDKRVMRAEEKANTLPTKMTLATMMLTVPPLLIILIGPSVYGITVLLGSQ